MQTEIEAKFPNINVDTLRVALKKLGATCIHPEVLMKRKTFDRPNKVIDKIFDWVRVRDEGDKITMSYKRLDDRTLHGTKEVNITVDDFENSCQFLTNIGMIMKSYQETRRESWFYKDVEITIDTWPWVPTFVEFECPSEEIVKKVSSSLGYDWKQALFGSVEPIYQMHYDFTDEEIDSWESITFVPEPAWLLAKKK